MPETAERKIEDAKTTPAHLSVEGAEATKILNGRRQANAIVSDIDDRLAHDLRVSTRIARLEQPSAIVDLRGHRPQSGREAVDDRGGRIGLRSRPPSTATVFV